MLLFIHFPPSFTSPIDAGPLVLESMLHYIAALRHRPGGTVRIDVLDVGRWLFCLSVLHLAACHASVETSVFGKGRGYWGVMMIIESLSLSFPILFFSGYKHHPWNNKMPKCLVKLFPADVVERSDGENGKAMEELRWFDTRSLRVQLPSFTRVSLDLHRNVSTFSVEHIYGFSITLS